MRPQPQDEQKGVCHEAKYRLYFLFCEQALESKLAACRNFAKDQAARKNYSKDNGTLINSNATKFSHSLHTTYFDKT